MVKTVRIGKKNTSRLLIFNCMLCSGPMAQWYEAFIFALEEVWGAGSNPGGATTRFLIFVVFFFNHIFTLLFVSVYSHW